VKLSLALLDRGALDLDLRPLDGRLTLEL